MSRPVYEIARDIRRNWVRPSVGARPYLLAMECIHDVNDTYGADSAKSVIRFFLSNAQFWRGDTARKIKQELKDLVGD